MKTTVYHWLRRDARGQSLVEMAISLPILIFMLIGVFEVGWALRGYLVLVNVNREITRFAVRPGYMDFSTTADVITSYQRIRGWVDTAVVDQLPLDFDNTTGNATLLISHFVIDTGQPCNGGCPPDRCDWFNPGSLNYNPTWVANNEFKADNIILHPGQYSYQATRFGPTQTTTGPKATRLNYQEIATTLTGKNNTFNCEVIKKGGVPSANNVIITELYYDQPQLFGFPLISNPFTDPVPLYTHTSMRLVNAARSTGAVEGNLTSRIDQIGPVCFVYPMVVHSGVADGDLVNIIAYDWLKWGNMVADDEEYLELALQYPQMSLNDYATLGGIQPGRTVNKVAVNNEALEDAVLGLGQQRLVIPTSSNPGANPVPVDGFVWATIESYDLAAGEIWARIDLSTPLPEACGTP